MYELVDIIEDAVTRIVKLKNSDTGIIEECFDDSEVVSTENFNFMQIGQHYDCKIKLFGKPVAEKTGNCVLCQITNESITIGKKAMVEVQTENGIYYIAQQRVKEYLTDNNFFFSFTRKDLIQVDDVIHADFL